MQAKYVSKSGEFLAGIPMRDLTEEDWTALDAEQRKLIRSSALYEVDKAEPTPGGKKEA